jgi:hypothetical protein
VGGLFEVESGTLLEDADKFQEIAFWFYAVRQEMQMVWHGAIGVKVKEEVCGALGEGGKRQVGGPWISEVGKTGVAADGDEVDFEAEIVEGGEADGFAVERHWEMITNRVDNVQVLAWGAESRPEGRPVQRWGSGLGMGGLVTPVRGYYGWTERGAEKLREARCRCGRRSLPAV